jgi:hypothetical protein
LILKDSWLRDVSRTIPKSSTTRGKQAEWLQPLCEIASEGQNKKTTGEQHKHTRDENSFFAIKMKRKKERIGNTLLPANFFLCAAAGLC